MYSNGEIKMNNGKFKDYDYKMAVYNDVLNYVKEEIDRSQFTSSEDLADYLKQILRDCDDVTGRGSHSYTCNSELSRLWISQNFELLAEALDNGGYSLNDVLDTIYSGADALDVVIRCYLLDDAIDLVCSDDIDDERK